MKELYIAATEEIIEELMAENPKMSLDEAYNKAADLAYERCRDKYADMVDAAKDRAKAEGNWPPKPAKDPTPEEGAA